MEFMKLRSAIILLNFVLLSTTFVYAGEGGTDPHGANINFPPSFADYHDADIQGVPAILRHRISHTPFNLVASLIFWQQFFTHFSVVNSFTTHISGKRNTKKK